MMQIALAEQDLDGAKRSFNVLREIAPEGDENVELLQRQIDVVSNTRKWRRSY
jgi:hypothetical protein